MGTDPQGGAITILVEAWPYIVFWTFCAVVGGLCVGIQQYCGRKLDLDWQGGDVFLAAFSILLPPIGIATAIGFLFYMAIQGLEDKASRRKALQAKKQREIDEMLAKEGFKA